jgi:integrase/recombinase XerD
MNHLLAPFIKSFLGHYLPVVKGLSINTVAAYLDGIRLLLCYIADTKHKSIDELLVEDVTETVVLNFLDHLEQIRHCCVRTRNARLAAIRSLFTFIARKEPLLIMQCQQVKQIPKKRCSHKVVHYLDENEMQAVLDKIDINSRTGVRDKALVLLLYNTGARVSEIVELKLGDMQLDNAPQVRLFGKGQKERHCPLWPETADAIKRYLQQRRPTETSIENVFLNTRDTSLSRYGIRYITRKLGAQAGNKNANQKPLNPHSIRHTAAMHLLRAGNEISMISFWMGHAHINTTHIYVEIDMEMKRKMLAKAGAPTVSDQKPWQQPGILKWLAELNKRPDLCAVNRAA